MTYDIGDIDVDVGDRDKVVAAFPEAVPAVTRDGKPHPGLYFTDIPTDPRTGRAAIDYEEAENRGYAKLDVLHLTLYENVRDEEHLKDLMDREPPWDMFLDRDFSKQLIQVSNHPRALEIVRPRNIEELAAVIALIRPGKKYLQEKSKDEIMCRIWEPETGGEFVFKKSHAYAYALTVAVHANLLAGK